MEERNASYLLNSFVIQKINDEIAFAAETPKLLEIGLVYGDLIAFRQRFPAPLENNNNITNYHERAKELKQKVLKKHSGRKDILERPISINRSYAVTFGFKYHERGRYRHKLNQNFVKTFSRDATYEELHDAARKQYRIKETSTFLGNYAGAAISKKFSNLSAYAELLKDKKRPLQFYLYYPKPYSRLVLEGYHENDNDFYDTPPSCELSNSQEAFENVGYFVTLESETLPGRYQPSPNNLHINTTFAPSSTITSSQAPSVSNGLFIDSESLSSIMTPPQSQSQSNNLHINTTFAPSSTITSSQADSVSNGLFIDNESLSSIMTPHQSQPQSNILHINTTFAPSSTITSCQAPSVSNGLFIDNESLSSIMTPPQIHSQSNILHINTTFAPSSTITSSQADSVSNGLFIDTNESNGSIEATRETMNSRPSRATRVPIRYRHSIGSPSSLETPSLPNTNLETFGNDEVDRFFDTPTINLPIEQSSASNEESLKEILTNLRESFNGIERAEKKLIVQRDINRFWPVIYRQHFDLSKQSLNVRFAGEAAADLGGPLSEFLTLCMQNFHLIPEVTGSVSNVYFHVKPQSCIDKRYFFILILFSILITVNDRISPLP